MLKLDLFSLSKLNQRDLVFEDVLFNKKREVGSKVSIRCHCLHSTLLSNTVLIKLVLLKHALIVIDYKANGPEIVNGFLVVPDAVLAQL